MLTDDQFAKYVNDRFAAIDDSRRRNTKEVEPPTAPFVLLAPVEPNWNKCTNSTDYPTRPFSEVA